MLHRSSPGRGLPLLGSLIGCLVPACVVSSAGAGILDVKSDTLTTYKPTSATEVQDVRPLAAQRGAELDGRARAGAMLPLALHGNPFGGDSVPGATMAGVRLHTGTAALDQVDLVQPGPGFQWVIGRTFNGRQKDSGGSYRDSDGPQGSNWFQGSLPEIAFGDDADDAKDAVYLVHGADRYVEFVRTSSVANEFKACNGAAGVMQFAAGAGAEPDTYSYYDQRGNVAVFFGFDADSGACKGQFWKFTDPQGNVAYVGHQTTGSTAISSGFDGSGRATTVYQALDAGATRRFTYDYTSGRLDSVTVAEKPSGGSYSDTGAKVEYTYYGSESHGDPGDLKLVTATTPLTDGGATLATWTYYRYYEGAYDATNNPGHPHLPKYVYQAEGLRQFDWTDTAFDSDFLTASNDDLKAYASAYFKYDAERRVVLTWANGSCGCSGGSNGEHVLEYETNGSFSGSSGYDTAWHVRTIVKQPERTDVSPATNAWHTQYFDEVGQTLHRVVTDADPDNTSPAPGFWATKVTRDSSGRTTQVCSPENITAYTHSSGSFTASAGAGLVTTYVRTSGGETDGFVEDVKHSTGTSGSAYLDLTTLYGTRAFEVVASGATVVRPMVSSRRTYTAEVTSGTSGSLLTSFSYDWWSSTSTNGLYIVPKKATTTYPAVTTGNNGSNLATTSVAYLRKDGTTAFSEAQDRIFAFTAYTNGRATKTIADAQTNHGSDFGSDDPNGVWGITETGSGLRKITTSTHDGQGRLDSSTLPDGRVLKRYYSKLADRRAVTLGYADYEATPKWHGPVSYVVSNHAGRPELQATVALANNESTLALTSHVDETDADPITAMDLGTVARMTVSIHDEAGSRVEATRQYFLVPASGAGSDGTNYDATTYAYDNLGHRWRTKDPTGTIRRTAYDAIGRMSSEWIGTNDNSGSFPGGESAGSPDMVRTSLVTYDSGATGGNSRVTKRTAYVEDGTTDQRETSFAHDVRGRMLLQSNPAAPKFVLSKYDNMGRVVASGTYTGDGSGDVTSSDDPTSRSTDRLALSQTFHDELGRPWKTQHHKIDQADGSDDDNLQTLRWYDAAGRLVKEDGEQLVKTAYDRLGRATRRYVLASDNDSAYGDADDVSGDIVLEEHQTVYDPAEDTVVLSAGISRFHDDVGGGQTTGALDTNADGDDLLYTAANIEGRIQITAMWHDRYGRLTDVAQYGTYAGGTFDRDPLSVPGRSATVLVTSRTYNTDGTLKETTDPRGLVTRQEYDALGRVTATIANYVNGAPSGSPTVATSVDDNFTRFVYVDGLRTKMWVDLDGDGTEDADDQVTMYTYGTTKGVSAGDSKIGTGHLLQKATYPDSASGTDVVTYAYDAQGEQIWTKDQAGNVIETNLDTMGRATQRRVTTLATGFDNAVLRISTGYDDLGRVQLVTSYDNATVGSGSVVNEVKHSYDNWGPLSKLEQDRDSAVAGGGNDYEVSYLLGKATTGRNTIRRSRVTLPDGSQLNFTYSSSSSHDDSASRVTSFTKGVVKVAEYRYNGVGRLVGTDLAEADVMWNLYTTSGSYPDLDRFDRVVQSRWTKDLGTDVDFVDLSVGLDENGNVTYVDDRIQTGMDVKYTIDSLDRLTKAEEGTYSGGSISSRTRQQVWEDATQGGLDQVGNWVRSKLDLNGDNDFVDSSELDEERWHNVVNELTRRDTDNDGTDDHTLTYDAAGNLTNDGKEWKYQYDAFGRLRKIRTLADVVISEYTYNGLGHRIGMHQDTDTDGDCDANDKWYHFVYTERWQPVAVYRESDSDPKELIVPHFAGAGGYGGSSYIDDVVLRDRDANTAWTSASDGTLEERRYFNQNWRHDVVAMVSDLGKLAEQNRYTPYGLPWGIPLGDVDSDGDCDSTDDTTVQGWIGGAYQVRGDVDLDFDVDAADRTIVQGNSGATLGRGALSYIGNRAGYAGYVSDDKLAKLHHVRHRVLQSEVGRWIVRDPARDPEHNLYELARSSPLTYQDPSGLTPTIAQSTGGASLTTVPFNDTQPDPEIPEDPPKPVLPPIVNPPPPPACGDFCAVYTTKCVVTQAAILSVSPSLSMCFDKVMCAVDKLKEAGNEFTVKDPCTGNCACLIDNVIPGSQTTGKQSLIGYFTCGPCTFKIKYSRTCIFTTDYGLCGPLLALD